MPVRTFLAAAALLAAASPAPGETYHAAGDDQALWLAVGKKGKKEIRYEMSFRTPEKDWETLPLAWKGQVRAVAAVEGQGVVFMDDGVNLWYSPWSTSPGRGTKPAPQLWPSDTRLLSVCSPPRGGGKAVLVLVHRPVVRPTTTTRFATTTAGEPTTAAKAKWRTELALLQATPNAWQTVAALPWPRAERAFLAVADRAAYVLVTEPEPAFLAVRDGRWQTLEVPKDIRRCRPLALVAVAGEPLLASFQQPRAGQVSLAAWRTGRWQGPKVVTRGDQAVVWPDVSPPAVARYGDRLVLIWPERGTCLSAVCGPDGRFTAPAEDVFRYTRAIETVNRIWRWFFYIVPGVIVALMLWPGQPLRTAHFTLPRRLPPAPLRKRIVAAGIDLVPFFAAAGLLIGPEEAQRLYESLNQGRLSVRVATTLLGVLVAYPAYGTVLEHLLGATLGKRALRLRVVGDGGRRASFRELALRNLSKVLELMVVLPLLVPLFTRYRQRLGDKISWTAVVDTTWTPPETEGQQPPEGEGDQPKEEKL